MAETWQKNRLKVRWHHELATGSKTGSKYIVFFRLLAYLLRFVMLLLNNKSVMEPGQKAML